MTTLLSAPPEHETQTPVLLSLLADVRPVAPARWPRLVSVCAGACRLRVQRVDVTERGDVAERLGVTTVPTLMLVKDRQVVAQLEGKITQQQIRDTFLPHLQREGRAA